jgi:hypothetical protein
MKTLQEDELFQNLQGFLKTKGVELKDGSYVHKIQKSCSLLSDAINTSQQGLTRAKDEIDKKLAQLRQVIHEKTAPNAPAASSAAPPPATPPQEPPSARAAAAKAPKAKSKAAKRPKHRKQ